MRTNRLHLLSNRLSPEMESEVAEASGSVFVSAARTAADFLSWTKAQNVVIEVYQLLCLIFVRLVLSLLSVPHVKLVLSSVGLGALITEASDRSTANAWTPAPAAATISTSQRASLLPPRHPKDSNRLTVGTQEIFTVAVDSRR